jgi:linoleoyl-CoA desaturase
VLSSCCPTVFEFPLVLRKSNTKNIEQARRALSSMSFVGPGVLRVPFTLHLRSFAKVNSLQTSLSRLGAAWIILYIQKAKQAQPKLKPMNKLKFTKDEGLEFYRELNQRLDAYFTEKNIPRTGNRIMYFKIFLYFSLDILFYSLMITSGSVSSFFVFYLLMGLSILLTAFNISHDAAHGVAVKTKFWNKLLFSLSFNLQGNNAYVWGKNHTESHHLYTNIEGSDIDVLNNPLFRMTETQPLKWFHRFQWIYAPFLYLLYSLNWFFFRETLMLFNYSSRTIKIHIPDREVVKLIFYKLLYLGYMIVLPILLLPFGWQTVIIAFLLNHFMVSWIFVGVLGVSHLSDFVQHPVPDADNKLNMSWAKLQMCTSVDYNAGSRFFNWTLGGFNAHALHHLLPNICHVHYINILPIFRELCQKHNITYMEMPYQRSLAAHFRFLKQMGKQQEFKLAVFEG